MFGLIKIAGLSAVLSAGLVTGFAPEPAAGGKLYQDRVAQSFEDAAPAARPVAFRLAAAETTGSIEMAAQHCTAQAWPNIAAECLSAASGTPARASVRTITIEKRETPNTSTLVRLPVDGPRR
ncbi:MAG TPA: hypothetical protein VKA39_05320 [Beijerinckiaceae bacterium]|nr:hypothetical protein [Beijerinckiaceae bacterium]